MLINAEHSGEPSLQVDELLAIQQLQPANMMIFCS